MRFATLSDADDFLQNFSEGTTPWIGLIWDTDTNTKIEVSRDAHGERIYFRTQGELVATYKDLENEDPLLQIFTPSADVDLALFSEKIREIYTIVSGISEKIRKSFVETPEELMDMATADADRVVIGIVMGVTVSP